MNLCKIMTISCSNGELMKEMEFRHLKTKKYSLFLSTDHHFVLLCISTSSVLFVHSFTVIVVDLFFLCLLRCVLKPFCRLNDLALITSYKDLNSPEAEQVYFEPKNN
jgi:hypothetical protein